VTQQAPDGADSFCHLHVHSEFSLLDGLSRVGEMTRRVPHQGMTAMALTDHGSMYGVIPFYAAAKSAGIKPIIGIEAYVAPRGMADKEGKEGGLDDGTGTLSEIAVPTCRDQILEIIGSAVNDWYEVIDVERCAAISLRAAVSARKSIPLQNGKSKSWR